MKRLLVLPVLLLVLTGCGDNVQNGGRGRATGWPIGLVLLGLLVGLVAFCVSYKATRTVLARRRSS